jgi:hypothetical protein
MLQTYLVTFMYRFLGKKKNKTAADIRSLILIFLIF